MLIRHPCYLTVYYCLGNIMSTTIENHVPMLLLYLYPYSEINWCQCLIVILSAWMGEHNNNNTRSTTLPVWECSAIRCSLLCSRFPIIWCSVIWLPMIIYLGLSVVVISVEWGYQPFYLFLHQVEICSQWYRQTILLVCQRRYSHEKRNLVILDKIKLTFFSASTDW